MSEPTSQVTITATLDGETPGTVKFREDRPQVGDRRFGTVYMRKEAWEELGKPEWIRITVDVLR